MSSTVPARTAARPSRFGTFLDRADRWTPGVLVANLVAQIVIVVTGALVRLTGSGLGCETWPQCQPGSFTPVRHAATGHHQLIEFGNRTLTFVLTVIAVATAVLVWRHTERALSVRVLGLVPLIGVVAQAVLGGITVLVHLNPAVVGLHLLVSMALIALSTLLLVRFHEGDGPARRLVDPTTWTLGRVLAVWTVPLLALGVLTTGSGPHGGDDEVAQRFTLDPELVARVHAGFVWVFLLLLVALLWRTHRIPTPQRPRRALLGLLAVTLLQGVIGYVQFFTGLPIWLVALHMLGAGLTVAAVTWAVLAMRERPVRPGPGSPLGTDRDATGRTADRAGSGATTDPKVPTA